MSFLIVDLVNLRRTRKLPHEVDNNDRSTTTSLLVMHLINTRLGANDDNKPICKIKGCVTWTSTECLSGFSKQG